MPDWDKIRCAVRQYISKVPMQSLGIEEAVHCTRHVISQTSKSVIIYAIWVASESLLCSAFSLSSSLRWCSTFVSSLYSRLVISFSLIMMLSLFLDSVIFATVAFCQSSSSASGGSASSNSSSLQNAQTLSTLPTCAVSLYPFLYRVTTNRWQAKLSYCSHSSPKRGILQCRRYQMLMRKCELYKRLSLLPKVELFRF